MKINIKHIQLIASSTLCLQFNLHALWDDQSIQSFIMRQQNLMKAMNESFDKFFDDIDLQSSLLKSVHQQNYQTPKSSSTNYYQQSSSMTLDNGKRAVKINERSTQDDSIYEIEVTNYQHTSEPIDALPDTLTELQELQTYISKNYASGQAHKILQTCINMIQQHPDNTSLDIQNSTQGNKKIYSIKITTNQPSSAQEIDADITEEAEEEQEKRKKMGKHKKNKFPSNK